MTVLRKNEFAKVLNVKASAVSKWIKAGLPTDRQGRINFDRGLTWIRGHVEPQISSSGKSRGAMRAGEYGNGRNDNGSDPVAARAERDRQIAEKYRLANDIAMGKVVLVEDCAKLFAVQCSTIRNHFLGLGVKLAPLLVSKTAPEIREMIDKRVIEILEILTNLDAGEDATEEERVELVRSRVTP